MTKSDWQSKQLSVTSLHLDAKNPRLGRETSARAPREIIQYLFEHDKSLDIAQSIATRGYFLNEPLLAVKEEGRYVVVEGNRRLAALKALLEPGLLDGSIQRKVERLSRRFNLSEISKIPVIVAPSRRMTDRLVAGRHIGTPVLAWQSENRASFILDKLSEGYTNEELLDDLGFSASDIQKARQTRAIADMARSLDLPEEVMAKLDSPRTKIFSTLERVFESSVGREFLKVKPNAEHGLCGATTKSEFKRGFTKLVTDVALGKQSSRSLNTNDDIQKYFESWKSEELPKKKRGSFVPSDLTGDTPSTIPAQSNSERSPSPARGKRKSKTILPTSLKVRFGNERLADLRDEMTKMDREKYPNSGAVLMRVFYELSVIHYLERTGIMEELIARLESKDKLPPTGPTLSLLAPEVIKVAKKHLTKKDAALVEKAVRPRDNAPFTITDLHAFVHSSDFPVARDIEQFWIRTEPLFRLMLERDAAE